MIPLPRFGRALVAVAATFLLPLHRLAAQTSYYNLDSGRPTRIEDALPTPLGELEVQFFPVRSEWVGDGTQRLRYEPKLSYGMLALTEIELRVPMMQVRAQNTPTVVGVASAALGALHAFNVETSWPALALAGEAVLPVGSLSAPTGSYSVKGVLTKTFWFGRVNLNAGGGTWSVRTTPVAAPQGYVCGNAPGVPPCLIPDLPCDVVPVSWSATSLACAPAAALSGAGSAAATSPRSVGPHWTAALGIDHAFPLVSTLLTVGVIVDRFVGLYPGDDWTVEAGFRKQLAPQFVVDVGAGRHFAGTLKSTTATLGVTFDMPLR